MLAPFTASATVGVGSEASGLDGLGRLVGSWLMEGRAGCGKFCED